MKSTKSQKSAATPHNHEFVVKTYQEPVPCLQCGTFMLGQYRQGIICENCEFPCHYSCAKNVPKGRLRDRYRALSHQGILEETRNKTKEMEAMELKHESSLLSSPPKRRSVGSSFWSHLGFSPKTVKRFQRK